VQQHGGQVEHRQHGPVRGHRRGALDRARHRDGGDAAEEVLRAVDPDRHPDPAVGAARGCRGNPLGEHLGQQQRSAEQPVDLVPPDRPLHGLPRPEPVPHDPRHRASAGVADHPAVDAADPRGAAEHPRRHLRGGRHRRRIPVGGLPADHPSARPPRHHHRDGAGDHPDAQRLRPALCAERIGVDRCVPDDADLLHQLPEPQLRRGVCAIAAHHRRHAHRIVPGAQNRLQAGGVLMKQRAPWARRIGVALILFWSLAPLYWAINVSLQTDAQAASKPSNYLPPTPSLNNYIALLSGNSDLSQSIRQSSINIVIECAAATLVTIVLATLAAYAFARMTFKGRKILFYTVLATMAFPAYTTLIPIYQILTGLSLVNTYTGIILVYVSGFLPLATWILYNYMSSLPIALEEAGTIDGASRMQVLWHIVPYTLLSAAGVIALAVPAVIALILNRYIVSGLLAGSVK